MNLKKHIPNTITAGNLFCGCLAIVSAFEGNVLNAIYLVGLALILDFLDGFVARLLNVKSEIGAQLDSLADMVTFGVFPGILMFFLLREAAETSNGVEAFPQWLCYSGFLITIFSAVRLAKFNVDDRQTDSFVGLPTPANTILICSIPLIAHFQPNVWGVDMMQFITNPWLLLGITIISSYLMVAELPLFALKFKNAGWADNKIRYIFIFMVIAIIFMFKIIAIPFTILLYLALSVLDNK